MPIVQLGLICFVQISSLWEGRTSRATFPPYGLHILTVAHILFARADLAANRAATKTLAIDKTWNECLLVYHGVPPILFSGTMSLHLTATKQHLLLCTACAESLGQRHLVPIRSIGHPQTMSVAHGRRRLAQTGILADAPSAGLELNELQIPGLSFHFWNEQTTLKNMLPGLSRFAKIGKT